MFNGSELRFSLLDFYKREVKVNQWEKAWAIRGLVLFFFQGIEDVGTRIGLQLSKISCNLSGFFKPFTFTHVH